MTVNQLIEMLTDGVSENAEFGEKEITMIGEETGDTVSLGGFYEISEAIHLLSEESEELE